MIAEIVACRTELQIPHAVACRALGVSESWFYKHRDRPPTATVFRRRRLDAAIEAVFAAEAGEYGSPRVHAELVECAEFARLSVNTVAKRMRHNGLRAKKRPVRRSLTRPDPEAFKFPNLLNRDFDPPAANVSWCGDITEIVTWEAKLYLATVIDLWSRRLIGFAIADHCKATVVADALRMAIAVRGGDVAGVVFHSDRGSQGGFNWSSQHLDVEVDDGKTSWVDDGVDGALADEVAGRASAPARGRARVLACDRDGSNERRGRSCRWCGIRCRVQVVPSSWGHAFDRCRSVVRPLSLIQ